MNAALRTHPYPDGTSSPQSWQIKQDPQTVWQSCADALARAFPGLAAEIDEVATGSPTCFSTENSKHPKPFTYDLGPNNLPFVSVPYRHTPFDVLAIAHEFGHAVQIVASYSRHELQSPPVARETCAFLSELAFLEFCTFTDVPTLSAAHHQEDHNYLKDCGNLLRSGLKSPNATYLYDWNYPIARHIAALAVATGQRDWAERLFRAGVQGGSLLASYIESTIMISQTASQNEVVSISKPEVEPLNYLPEVPSEPAELPTIEAYRSLGMMTHLDLDYWLGHSELSIKEYYARLAHHLKTKAVYIVIGDEDKPIGYATWNADDAQPDQVEFTRQAAPFGDHLRLQKSLQKRLPHVKTARSINSRSARQEQVAW